LRAAPRADDAASEGVGDPVVSESGPVTVRVYASTDVGQTRDHNEDAFLVADLSTGTPITFPQIASQTPGDHGAVFMVADGMGGAAAGEIASSMAVEVVLRELQTRWTGTSNLEAETFAKALVAATSEANERIHTFAKEHPEYRGMGTTATVAGILGDTLYIAQVGDSRAYLVRHGVARQLTKDQSLMQRLIEAGEITVEEAEVSERRNIILQALGPEAAIKVDITHQQLRRGDTLVLCSDGLSGLVRDQEIADAINEERDLRLACRRMITAANTRGGPDNITVVAAEFDGAGLAEPAESDLVGHQTFPVGDAEPATNPILQGPRAIYRTSGGTAVDAPPPGPEAQPRRSGKTNTLEIVAPRRTAPQSPWLPPIVPLIAAAIVVLALIAYLWGKKP
jgi:protein phosphatase